MSSAGTNGTRRRSSEPPPESVEEALGRAGRHGRAAVGELLAALRALLDAASLATAGVPSDQQQRLARLSSTLETLSQQLTGGDDGATLLSAVLESLDEEIQRWEARSRDDADARPVLRAFLGMREILWELGVRPAGEGAEAQPGAANRRRGRKVQRVPVED